MQPPLNVLPRSLQPVAKNSGLEFLTHAGGISVNYPLACRKLPVFQDPVSEISMFPVQMNFSREVLDMDKQDDREEYNRIMTYYQAGYGMKIIYHERRFIKKISSKGGKTKRRTIQRIFIEYYAPYRVIANESH